jgi:S-adenosylmethionine:tRNA-ribosyltransferase-isomerase (queuine synthetase)
MTINTANKKIFELLNENKVVTARLIYANNAFDDAIIETEEEYLLNGIATGVWITHFSKEQSLKIKSKIRVETGGVISIEVPEKKKKYIFKKSTGWKLRFSLAYKDGEDLLTIITNVNWHKESHDYILQLNEEFETECDSFLILQAVHCANCSLSMMTGGEVPALVSI